MHKTKEPMPPVYVSFNFLWDKNVFNTNINGASGGKSSTCLCTITPDVIVRKRVKYNPEKKCLTGG